MAKVKSIRYIGKKPVYNMTVEKYHNFMIQGNVISKNCDSLRYFCSWWTIAPEKQDERRRSFWTSDRIEDYENANEEGKRYLIEKYGEPIL